MLTETKTWRETPEFKDRSQFLAGFLLFALVLVMLNLSFSIGDRRIAGAAVVMSLAAFITYEFIIDKSIEKQRLLILYLTLPVFFLLSNIMHIDEYMIIRLESTSLLIASTSSIIVLYYIFSIADISILKKYILYLILFVLIFAIFEANVQLFRGASDAFRNFLYEGAFMYSSDDRDFLIAGKIRPKVFTQEPSHVAKLLAFSICAYGLLIAQTIRNFIIVIALFITSLVIIGSQTIILGAILYVFLFVFLSRYHHRQQLFVSYVSYALLIAIVFLYLNLPWVASFLPGERMELIAQGLDNSTLSRSEGPKQVFLEMLQDKPFFGIGIGAREAVQDIVIDVYSNFSAFFVQNIIDNPGYHGWGNAFFEVFIYFGIINGFIFFLVLGYVMNRLGLPAHGFVAIFVLVFTSDSGFTAPRVWFYFSLVSAASITFRSRIERCA